MSGEAVGHAGPVGDAAQAVRGLSREGALDALGGLEGHVLGSGPPGHGADEGTTDSTGGRAADRGVLLDLDLEFGDIAAHAEGEEGGDAAVGPRLPQSLPVTIAG